MACGPLELGGQGFRGPWPEPRVVRCTVGQGLLTLFWALLLLGSHGMVVSGLEWLLYVIYKRAAHVRRHRKSWLVRCDLLALARLCVCVFKSLIYRTSGL